VTGWERIVSYVAVALTAGSVVALIVTHEGPLWQDAPVSQTCRDSFFMTCQASDDGRECTPGARGSLEQFQLRAPIDHGCVAWVCRCSPSGSAAPLAADAGPPDVSLDAGGAADGA
jgi:hypothetical protein